MELKQLSNRAIQIRNRYAKLEKERVGEEWTNLNIMEGFVGDIGDLMKLVMAKEGVRQIEDVDKKFAHELADCLWSVLVLAERYEIDLEKEFMRTMADLEKRIS